MKIVNIFLSFMLLTFSISMTIGQKTALARNEVQQEDSLTFHVLPIRKIVEQGKDIDLRFLFYNQGPKETRICTRCKSEELFNFFFRVSGTVDDKVIWYTTGGKASLMISESEYVSLRPQEFWSFTHTMNDIMQDDNNIVVQKDDGTQKKGDIITGKQVLKVTYYSSHGEDCFHGMLEAAEPVKFEIVERGTIPPQMAPKKPGGLEFSAVLAKQEFTPKEDILVDFTFSNTGTEKVTILAEFEPFDTFFSVEGQNEKDETWSNRYADGNVPTSPRYVTLEPRESFGFRKKLNDLMNGQDTHGGKQQVKIKYANQQGESGFKGELQAPVLEFEIVKP